MKEAIKQTFGQFQSLSSRDRKNLLFIGLTLFLILFSYPMIRSTTTGFFLDAFGAKKMPLVWLYSVIGLSLIVSFLNQLQVKFAIHRLMLGIGFFSAALFFIGSLQMHQGNNFFAYPLFVWKEIYIVIMMHSTLAFLNISVDLNFAKLLYGPIGAIGSLGGIIGGICAKTMLKSQSVETVLFFGGLIILLASLSFWKTDHSRRVYKVKEKNKKLSPLASIQNVRFYVGLIVVLVVLTQVVINLANFKFNLFLETITSSKIEKTSYLASVYTLMNAVGFFFQVLILPFLFKYMKLSSIHFAMAVAYFAIFGLTFIEGTIPFIAVMFITYKGINYSLFSSAKDLLYFKLSAEQKFGAKYIVDMIFYRLGKGAISAILLVFQSVLFVNIALVTSLSLWIICLIPLFKEYKKLGDISEYIRK